MIAPEPFTEELVIRHSFGGSIVSLASKYIKDAWARKRCVECAGKGGHQCKRCGGGGLINGEGSSAAKEPCRRCIGTGREECVACDGVGFVSSSAAHAH